MDEVRIADTEELPLLPALEAASDAVFAPLGLGPFPPPGNVAELRAARAVLVVGAPPLGFARIEEVDGRAHLEQLSVHPDHTRSGLGTRLLEAACAWARGAGYPGITLCTFADIPWNAPFYARHGFTILAPAELTPGLRGLREHEVELGMDALGPRVAMLRPLEV
jgi:GNAT superfamily N-acetyltransferase